MVLIPFRKKVDQQKLLSDFMSGCSGSIAQLFFSFAPGMRIDTTNMTMTTSANKSYGRC